MHPSLENWFSLSNFLHHRKPFWHFPILRVRLWPFSLVALYMFTYTFPITICAYVRAFRVQIHWSKQPYTKSATTVASGSTAQTAEQRVAYLDLAQMCDCNQSRPESTGYLPSLWTWCGFLWMVTICWIKTEIYHRAAVHHIQKARRWSLIITPRPYTLSINLRKNFAFSR